MRRKLRSGEHKVWMRCRWAKPHCSLGNAAGKLLLEQGTTCMILDIARVQIFDATLLPVVRMNKVPIVYGDASNRSVQSHRWSSKAANMCCALFVFQLIVSSGHSGDSGTARTASQWKKSHQQRCIALRSMQTIAGAPI